MRARGGTKGSTLAVGDAALAQVVGSQFNANLVAGENTNIVFAHLAGNVGGYHVAIFQLHPESGVGRILPESTAEFYRN